jgi:sensor histidine kinase YesM
LKDSLLGVEAAAEIAEQRVKYETAAKEAEIKLLEAQSQALQLDSERKTSWVIIVISIAFGLFLLIILFLVRSRANQKVLETELARKKAEFGKKKADLEQRALRAQMNPHFLFNSLNAIQRLYVQGNIDKAGDFMADFAQLLRKILDHSGVQKVLIAEEIETLRLYLGIEQSRIGGVFEFEITIDDEIDIYNTYMPPLLVQPFAENAIWHGIVPLGRPGKIIINFSGVENRADFDLLKCTVEDDGVGIENSKKEKSNLGSHKSKGMSLTTERLAPLGSVNAVQKPDGGTKVTIIIPLILNE